MSELHEDWHDWRYDGRGYYLVNDPEITFQDDVEAMVYCDEHNRALIGEAAIRERERIVAMIDAHMAFHNEAADEGEKSGVEMPSIRGSVGGLSMLKRDLMK